MTTRKIYNLPRPTNTYDTFSTWFTGHPIKIDGDSAHDGGILHDHTDRVIDVEAHENEVPTLDYADAERVALAILAAVEEAKTLKENR